MSDDASRIENSEARRGCGCVTAWMWPLMFFGLGLSMLAWPGAFPPSSSGCDPGPYGGELLDCLMGDAWGQPDAIALCFILAVLMGFSVLRSRWRLDDSP